MEGVSGRVEPHVDAHPAGRQARRERGPVGRIMDEAAGVQLTQQIHRAPILPEDGADPDVRDRSGEVGPRGYPPPVSDRADLAAAFRAFATEAGRRAPLYVTLAGVAAEDPEIHSLLHHAPPTQQRPVLLLAAVHHLVLGDPDSALARHYPSIIGRECDDDPRRDFTDFVLDRRDELAEIVATRSTQTNEIGRSSILVSILLELAGEGHRRIGLLDIGCSAGLNLLLDEYRHRFTADRHGAAWPDLDWPADGASDDATEDPARVHLECSLRDLPRPVPHGFAVVERLGIDREPVDIRDPEASRWLEACVWPDQSDRLARLRAALSLARSRDLTVRQGEAVTSLADGVATVGADPAVLPVIVNTWVLAYLDEHERRRYSRLIDEIGAHRDLTWVYAEAPDDCTGLDRPGDPRVGRLTCIMQVDWRNGRRTVRFRGPSHPHGYWMHRPLDATVIPGVAH